MPSRSFGRGAKAARSGGKTARVTAGKCGLRSDLRIDRLSHFKPYVLSLPSHDLPDSIGDQAELAHIPLVEGDTKGVE